jgi:hypothetical protein
MHNGDKGERNVELTAEQCCQMIERRFEPKANVSIHRIRPVLVLGTMKSGSEELLVSVVRRVGCDGPSFG